MQRRNLIGKGAALAAFAALPGASLLAAEAAADAPAPKNVDAFTHRLCIHRTAVLPNRLSGCIVEDLCRH